MRKILVALAIALSPVTSFAQNDQIANGYTPGHSYVTKDIDTVDLASGNLMVHIPLLSFKQQDPVSIDYSLTYTGKHLINANADTEFGSQNGWLWIEPFDSYVPAQGSVPGPAYAGFRLSSNQDWRSTWSSQAFSYSLPEIISPDGARHLMLGTADGHSRSTDATGLQYLSSDTALSWPFSTGDLDLVLDTNGVAHTVWTDNIILLPSSETNPDHAATVPLYLNSSFTNVPQIQFGSDGRPNGIQDAVGRQLPWPDVFSGSIGTETNDLSHCLGGALPVHRAFVVSFPGGNYTFCYTQIALLTNFSSHLPTPQQQQNYAPEEYRQSRDFLQSVYLPNGRSWLFEYQDRDITDPAQVNYGSLTKITYPTGGSVQYTYAMSPGFGFNNFLLGQLNRRVSTRTETSPEVSAAWKYDLQVGNGRYIPSGNDGEDGPSCCYYYDDTIVTVTNPDGTSEKHEFRQDDGIMAEYEDATTIYDPAGRVLSKRQYCQTVTGGPVIARSNNPYGGNIYVGGQYSYTPLCIQDILPNGQMKITHRVFNNEDLGFGAPGFIYNVGSPSLGLPTEEWIYDYGLPLNGDWATSTGNLLKHTVTAYQFQSDTSAFSLDLLDLVSSQSISDAIATRSTTTNQYDSVAVTMPGGFQPTIKPLASTTRAINSSTTAVTRFGHDDYGVRTSISDPNQHSTSLTYDGNDVYLTKTTLSKENGLNGVLQQTIDGVSGEPQLEIDENSHSITKTYDALGRLTKITPADANTSGTVTLCYGEDVTGSCADGEASDPVNTVYVSVAKDASSFIKAKASYDAFGRPSATAYRDAGGWIRTDTTYDSMGRVVKVSLPYREGGSASGYVVHQYNFTELGPQTIEQHVDSTGTVSSQITKQFSNNCVDIVDGRGNHTKQCFDSLGRLQDLWEPDETNSPTIHTAYNYDALGNLTKVSQAGSHGDTPRVRTFVYDGLSRLVAAHNPETGSSLAACPGTTEAWSVCYGYDPVGNLTSKQDARGYTTQYSYDSRNRLLSKRFYAPGGGLDTGTPSACYQYDVASGWGSANFRGKLVAEWTQPGSCASLSSALSSHQVASYDSAGRIKGEFRCVLGRCSGSAEGYSYDLVGNLIRYSNQSSYITRSFDLANRLSEIIGLYKVNAFDPAGPTSIDIGTKINEVLTYDSMHRPSSETVVVKP